MLSLALLLSLNYHGAPTRDYLQIGKGKITTTIKVTENESISVRVNFYFPKIKIYVQEEESIFLNKETSVGIRIKL